MPVSRNSAFTPRLTRALSKEDIAKATPIQRKTIPLILEGKDIVARAKIGYGKTFDYILPMLQKLFSEGKSTKPAPSAFILIPTRELCQQVYSEALPLLEFCRVPLRVVQLTASMDLTDMVHGLPFENYISGLILPILVFQQAFQKVFFRHLL